MTEYEFGDCNDRLICVCDAHNIDRLLVKLIAVHGEPRYDIAREITVAARTTVRRVEASAELVLPV